MATTTFQGFFHASIRMAWFIGGEALFGLAEVSTKARGDIERDSIFEYLASIGTQLTVG